MIALTKITDEVAEIMGVSERTLRRRFETFVNSSGGNYDELKDEHGHILFQDDLYPVLKAVIVGLAEDKSSIHRLVKRDFETRKEFLDAVNQFIQEMIEAAESGQEGKSDTKWKTEEIAEGIIRTFDLLFGYSATVEEYEIERLMETYFINARGLLMTYRMIMLEKLKDYMIIRNIAATTEMALYSSKLVEVMSLQKEFGGEGNPYGNDAVADEYMERDREVYQKLLNDKALREYVEHKTGVNVLDAFEHIKNLGKEVGSDGLFTKSSQ